MKLVLFFASWVFILSDVHAETSAEIKVPYAIITSGNMLDNIMRLQRMVINMSWELEATKTDLKTTKVALETTKEKLESALSELSRMDSMDGRIEEIENMTEISRIKSEVLFQAKQIKYPYTPGKYEALKFDTVSMNKGGGYNPTSGIFTVPRTGTYVCLANVLPDNSNNFSIRLMKEGQVMSKGYTGSGARQGAATISYMASLNKGDHVWFDIQPGDTFEIEGGHYSSYGCYLM